MNMLDSVSDVAQSPRERPEFARFAVTRNEKRQGTRERIHARVVHPIDTPRLLPDPLERRESRALSAFAAIRIVVAAGVIHAAVILSFAVIGYLMGQQTAYPPPERLTVRVIETPPPPPPVVEEPPVEAAPVVPEFQPVAPPKRPDSPAKEPAKTEDAPELAPEPDPAPRRIVGLSLESTVEGTGPAFATGTSRMGRTDPRATDPTQARRAPAAEPAPTAASQPGVGQRAASHIPTRDTQFEKPKRLKPNRPEFPAALKAQGIEGDVTVRVDIAASGAVTSVIIVSSSGYPAFDDAAKRAAASERFAPAIRDGNPVPFSLSYSYRFRIED
jgi:periplasmic protein TonB